MFDRLGYVGLPLAVAFAEKFKVVGFDIDESRIRDLKDGIDKTLEVESNLLESVKSNITTHLIFKIQRIVIFILLRYPHLLIK